MQLSFRGGFIFPRLNRDTSFKQLYKYFEERLTLLAKDPKDKKSNFLIATSAAPGMGKSFFLDEVAALSHKDISTFISGTKLGDILRNSVAVVSVTYNKGMRDLYYDQQFPGKMIAVRILYR